MVRSVRLVVFFVCVVVFQGCDSSHSSSAVLPAPAPASADNSSNDNNAYEILTTQSDADVSVCPEGGIVVKVGRDDGETDNHAGNNTLDSEEVEVSKTLCYPEATGPSVYPALTLQEVPSLEECPYGGAVVHTGLDNGDGEGSTALDGVLSDGEIDSSVKTCQNPPEDFALLNVEFDASTAECPYGGTVYAVGLDNGDGDNSTASDGVLSEDETDNRIVSCKEAVAEVATRGIQIPRVAVVPSNRGNSRTGIVENMPLDADYFTDKTQYQTYDITDAAFGNINQIICMLNATRYVEMLEKGHTTYIAKIHNYQCPARANGDYVYAGMPAGMYPPYHRWVVHVSRPEHTPYPILVRFWGSRMYYDTPSAERVSPAAETLFYLSGEMNVYAAPTEGNPYGEIRLRAEQAKFNGLFVLQPLAIEVSKKTHNNQDYIESSYFWNYGGLPAVRAAIRRDLSGRNGYGSILLEDYTMGPSPFGSYMYYNFRHTETMLTRSMSFLSSADPPSVVSFENVHSFDRTSLKETTRGYGFYNKYGERISAGYYNMAFWVDYGLPTQALAECNIDYCRLRIDAYDYSGVYIPNRRSFQSAHIYFGGGPPGREMLFDVKSGVLRRVENGVANTFLPTDRWEGSTELACVVGCVNPTALSSDDIYYSTDQNNPQFYQFDPVTYELSQTVNNIKYIVKQDATDKFFENMVLFEKTEDFLTQVRNGVPSTSLPVYYQWSSGSNLQNRMYQIKEMDGSPVVMGYDIENWEYPNTGNTEFPGPRTGRVITTFNSWILNLGDLCLDKNTNVEVSCTGSGYRVLPQISVPANTVIRYDNRDFVVRPYVVESRMEWLPDAVPLELTPVDLGFDIWGSGPQRTQSPSVCGGVAVDAGKITDVANRRIYWASQGAPIACPEGQYFSTGSWIGDVNLYGTTDTSNASCQARYNDGICDTECLDDGLDCLY